MLKPCLYFVYMCCFVSQLNAAYREIYIPCPVQVRAEISTDLPMPCMTIDFQDNPEFSFLMLCADSLERFQLIKSEIEKGNLYLDAVDTSEAFTCKYKIHSIQDWELVSANFVASHQYEAGYSCKPFYENGNVKGMSCIKTD